MSSKRIHYAFDGTLAYDYNRTTGTKSAISTSSKYTLDGDATNGDYIMFENGGIIFNFPDTLSLDKIGWKDDSESPTNGTLIIEGSTNSTDGLDGTWATLKTVDPIPSDVVYVEWAITPTNVTWLRFRRTSTDTTFDLKVFNLHIFGEYQAPRFEFWDTTETTKFTANYPLDMADAPNYADYNGSISFKLKNVDASTHSYNFNLNSIKWNDSLDLVKDVTIDNYFQITKAGLPTDMSDTFTASNGTDADKVKWTTTKAGNALDIQGNELHFNMSVVGTYAYAQSKFRLSGNFDIQVDFSDFTASSTNENRIEFVIQDITGLYYALVSTAYDSGNKFGFKYANGGAATYVTIARTNSYGKLRLVRSGSSISFYYQDGGGAMTLYQTISLFSTDVFVQFGSKLVGGTITGDVDNFVVNTLSPVTVIEWDTILMDGILTGAFTPAITVSAAVLIANNPADGYHQFAVDVTEYA